MEHKYKVYIIKNKVNGSVYVGRTDSDNGKYNPVSVLYSRFKKDDSKYTKLGNAIKEHGFKNFVFTFVKTDLSEDDSTKVMEIMKEKYHDKCLNDEVADSTPFFVDELKFLSDAEFIDKMKV